MTYESRLSFWLSWGVLLAGMGSGLASAYLVVSTYSPLPHWDEWALFDHLARGGGWSLNWLWAQHNEHRILVTKLFFLLDVDLFRGTQAFLLVSVFLVQLLQVGLLSWSLRRLGGLSGSTWRVGAGLIAYCILCPTQYENLVWGFQLQFVVPATMATVAVLALLLYHRSRHPLLLAISMTAATLATWSLANGMLLWPILLFAALLLGMSRRASLAISLVGLCNIGLYFFHYHRPSSESVNIASRSLGEMLRYIIVYFGSTFVRHSSGSIALIAGFLGICAALVIVVRVLRQRTEASPLLVELSLLMLFCLATAAITSTGRLHLGLEQATASRYQTFALLFWCCLGLALLVSAARARFDLMAACLLVLMLAFATQLRMPLIDAQWHQLRLRMVSLALITGVNDDAVLADAYPDPQVVLRAAEYMQQKRLSIFAGKEYAQLGQPLDVAYRLSPPSACSGRVISSQVLPVAQQGSGLRLTGYAWNTQAKVPTRNVIAVVDGRIAGFGTSVAIPLASGPQSDPARFGWVGFARRPQSGDKVHLYALQGKNDEACPFAEIAP